ncbi:MAG: hypothetical protein M1818_006585 [Claussenomyces sp. TS43310]|nr:MAG: hypothetical protein M1818_006585 [Claussenomyces sp. TS43310]
MSSTTENDAEDVNDFLKRIQELGTKRDQEDEERTRKLEEEILQGRKERQARRAERARSISPTKDSPTVTPPYTSGRAGSFVTDSISSPPQDILSSPPNPQVSSRRSTPDRFVDDAMAQTVGDDSPSKENAAPFMGKDLDKSELGSIRATSIKSSPSSAMPSRNSTLSWQRRPPSQSSDRPRSRPLSMIATENAARSPKATPERSPGPEDAPRPTRDQIAQSLATKDPAWFRQTVDRGLNSPAFRKTQMEDNDVIEVNSSSNRVQLPGMSHEVNGNTVGDKSKRSTPPSRISSSNGGAGINSFRESTRISSSVGSPVPQTRAQIFEPPGSEIPKIGDESFQSNRALAMSPSQGRISPEKLDRSSSPTKGMGGFVQSAMMKRSDSVTKRWSVQSPPGLSRGNSVASNRSSYSQNAGLGLTSPPARHQHSSSTSRDNSPLPLSRPTSSHSNATIVQENRRPGSSESMRSNMTMSTMSSTNDVFVKPSLPASRSQTSLTTADPGKEQQSRVENTPPPSPSKVTGRWSPTKSSWLESALNKPDSPKPKVLPTPQPPSWMAEINKAKQRGPAATTRSPTSVVKHEVNIGGLLRSPPVGGPVKLTNMSGVPVDFPSKSITKARKPSEPTSSSDSTGPTDHGVTEKKDPNISLDKTTPPKLKRPVSMQSFPKDVNPSAKKPLSPATGKIKPETPPKKDLRSSLKTRQEFSEDDQKPEAEFKNVFGQLRRTRTQNYVAPDELKNNILRGKAGLSVTGGPKKSERKDEFKDAILKKKEDFKQAQHEGVGVKRPTSSSKEPAPLPEALAKKAALGKSDTIKRRDGDVSDNRDWKDTAISSSARTSGRSAIPDFPHESSAPGQIESRVAAGSKLAARFNPTLSGILARGPPASSESPRMSSTSASAPRKAARSTSDPETDMQGSGPQLKHMTKSRARGPRRKAPSAVTNATSISPAKEAIAQEPERSIATPRSVFPLTEQRANSQVHQQPKALEALDESENQDPDRNFPRKLDLKRQSKFLEEAANKNDKTLKQLETPQSFSSSNADLAEIPMKQESVPSEPEVRHTPIAKPKPSSLSPTVTKYRDGDAALSTPSPETKRKLTPTPLSPTKFNASSSPSPQKSDPPALDQKPRSLSERTTRAAIPSRIKDTASHFSRSVHTQSPSTKAPILLPTQADEEAAMVVAGLGPHKFAAQVQQPSANQTPDNTGLSQSSGRPLPTPPSKPAGTPSKSARNDLSQGVARTSTALSSETSNILRNFFSMTDHPPAFGADTSAILSSRVDNTKIKRLRSQLYQLSGDGKKQAVSTHQERILFEGNMYLCTHTFGNTAGKITSHVYFWAGDEVSEPTIEDSEIFAIREAKSVGGQLVRMRQGKETPEFIEALGGIVVIRRGTSNKYDSLAPHILCARRHVGQIVFDEVDFTTASLCSGFSYLISTANGRLYLWKGKGSSIDELSCARLIGMDSGLTGELEEVDEGKEPASFLKIFGNDARINQSADHWRLKPNYGKYCGRLFHADASSQSQITEIAPFSQRDMFASQIYILDAFFEMYIIVGSQSQGQYASFCTALLFAQEYGILASSMEDRPFVPVSTVVLEGVPRDLKFVFRKWRDALAPTVVRSSSALQRGRSLRVLPLTAALEATRA